MKKTRECGVRVGGGAGEHPAGGSERLAGPCSRKEYSRNFFFSIVFFWFSSVRF